MSSNTDHTYIASGPDENVLNERPKCLLILTSQSRPNIAVVIDALSLDFSIIVSLCDQPSAQHQDSCPLSQMFQYLRSPWYQVLSLKDDPLLVYFATHLESEPALQQNLRSCSCQCQPVCQTLDPYICREVHLPWQQ